MNTEQTTEPENEKITPRPLERRVRPATFDDWFLSLEDGRKAILRDDKWRLAQAAFDAAFILGQQYQERSNA